MYSKYLPYKYCGWRFEVEYCYNGVKENQYHYSTTVHHNIGIYQNIAII